jgi:hypothetical protein
VFEKELRRLWVCGFVFGAFEGGWVKCHGLWLPAWVVVFMVGCGFRRGCGCFCRSGSVIVDIVVVDCNGYR